MINIFYILQKVFQEKDNSKKSLYTAILLKLLGISNFAIFVITSISISSLKTYFSHFKTKGEIKIKQKRGRKKKEEVRKIVLDIAGKSPEEFGLPYIRWTTRKLSSFISKNYFPISHQSVRNILLENGIRFRNSKGKIKSPDPLYAQKKKMLSRLKEIIKGAKERLIHTKEGLRNFGSKIEMVFWDESRKALKVYEGAKWTAERIYHKVGQEVSKIFSFFACLRGKIKGIVREGYANSEKFLEFLCFLIFEYAKEGVEQLIVVYDNAKYHAKWVEEEVMKIGEEMGIKVGIFRLPKQSPWLNPVEAEWKIFKEDFLSLKEWKDEEEFIKKFFDFIKFRNDGIG